MTCKFWLGIFVALGIAGQASAATQSTDAPLTQEQYTQMYDEWLVFQRAVALDDVCEVLDIGARTAAMDAATDREFKLKQAFGDQIKPAKIRAEARRLFKGCLMRETMPDGWAIIDKARKHGATMVVAPHVAGLNLKTCPASLFLPPSPEELKIVADKALQRFTPAQRREILADAAKLKPQMDAACADTSLYGRSRDFYPMSDAYNALQEYRSTAKGKADPTVRAIKPARKSKRWEAGYRSYMTAKSNPTRLPAKGYRFHAANPIAVTITLPGKEYDDPSPGTFYFMRDGRIRAKTIGNHREVFLKDDSSGLYYPLARLNPKVKPDPKKNRFAEFEMRPVARERMRKIKTRNPNFKVGLRTKPGDKDRFFYFDTKGRAFVTPDTAVLSMFEVNTALDFAMAPSALDQ